MGKEVGKTVELCGWVSVRRDHGKIIFIDLRDRSGVAQVVFIPKDKELYNISLPNLDIFKQSQYQCITWKINVKKIFKNCFVKFGNYVSINFLFYNIILHCSFTK